MRPTDGTASAFERASLGYDRYCDEIVAQTDLLRFSIEGADLAIPRTLLPQLERRPAAAAPRWRPTLG